MHTLKDTIKGIPIFVCRLEGHLKLCLQSLRYIIQTTQKVCQQIFIKRRLESFATPWLLVLSRQLSNRFLQPQAYKFKICNVLVSSISFKRVIGKYTTRVLHESVNMLVCSVQFVFVILCLVKLLQANIVWTEIYFTSN